MPITMSVTANYSTDTWLEKLLQKDIMTILGKYGQEGVEALRAATPVDTGSTANSWSYEVQKTTNGFSLNWTNSNVKSGVNIAVILQYGHGTRNGGYVEGIDYINPALKPVFEHISEEAWKEVVSK